MKAQRACQEQVSTHRGDWGAAPSVDCTFDDQVTAARGGAIRKGIVYGKHIYTEKPTASGIDGARELARLERERPRVRFSNITATAKLIAVGALQRLESRGAQMRSDYPVTDDAWHHRTYLTLREADLIAAEVTG
mgnify:CR=1 FL=1